MGFRLSYDYLLSVPRPAGPIVLRPEKGSQHQTSVSTPWSTGGLRWRGPGRQASTSVVRLATISSPPSLSQISGPGATSALTAQVTIPSTHSQLIFPSLQRPCTVCGLTAQRTCRQTPSCVKAGAQIGEEPPASPSCMECVSPRSARPPLLPSPQQLSPDVRYFGFGVVVIMLDKEEGHHQQHHGPQHQPPLPCLSAVLLRFVHLLLSRPQHQLLLLNTRGWSSNCRRV